MDSRREIGYEGSVLSVVDYTGGSGPDFRLRQGDIVELLDESRHPLLHADWLYGRCERTKVDGSFPYDTVYVLPTAERPDDKFLVGKSD